MTQSHNNYTTLCTDPIVLSALIPSCASFAVNIQDVPGEMSYCGTALLLLNLIDITIHTYIQG